MIQLADENDLHVKNDRFLSPGLNPITLSGGRRAASGERQDSEFSLLTMQLNTYKPFPFDHVAGRFDSPRTIRA